MVLRKIRNRNKLEKKSKGFTFIEMIVALVIMGIVATLSYPSVYRQIERSKGEEAVNTLGDIRNAIERCGIQNNFDFTLCDWSEMGLNDPSNANFTYTYPLRGDGTGVNKTYTLLAVGSGGDTITIARADTTVSTCNGTGAYQGLCT
jgi:type IV pilus assembly protein PilE